MAWVELTLPTASLSVDTDGVIQWNSGLQLLMGDPVWVDLMWDAAENRMGVRAVNSPTGIPVVKEPEGSEYKLDSEDLVADAGITVDENVEAEPDTWQQVEAGGGATPATWFGYDTIYYITLPE